VNTARHTADGRVYRVGAESPGASHPKCSLRGVQPQGRNVSVLEVGTVTASIRAADRGA